MLILGKKERVYYGEDRSEVKFEEKKLEEFLVANFTIRTDFEDGLTVEGLLNHFSELRSYILLYFTEHYDKAKAVIISNNNIENYSELVFYKKLTIEDGRIYLQPSYELLKTSNEGCKYNFLSQLPVVIKDTVVVIEENKGEYVNDKEIKCDFTLMDILEALFVDVIYDLTEGVGE